MSRQCNNNLSRAISIADYILEDDGHSVAEATIEFKYGKSTIQRDINYLGAVAFYGNEPNEKELKEKYVKVKKTLARLTKEHSSNNIKKWNTSKKAATSK